MGDDATFDAECQSMPSHDQQVAAETSAPIESDPFRPLDHGMIGRIKWTFLIDEQTKESFLHVENFPSDKLEDKESYFAGFGFSQQQHILPFSFITKKIHEHTSLKSSATTTPITPDK